MPRMLSASPWRGDSSHAARVATATAAMFVACLTRNTAASI